MHPAISYQLATARAADLHHQAERDSLARAAAHVPSRAAQPGRRRILGSLRRVVSQRRFGERLWTLLHAQTLVNGPSPEGHGQ
jgi:hypothetical protein